MGQSSPTVRCFFVAPNPKKALEIDCILFSPFYVFVFTGYGALAENTVAEKAVYSRNRSKSGGLNSCCPLLKGKSNQIK